jgi:hypothetical protein
MTEAAWLAATNSATMLEWLRRRTIDQQFGWRRIVPLFSRKIPIRNRRRKLVLFDVACCRRGWHLLVDERSRHAVEVAERWADGLADEDERREALRSAQTAHVDFMAAGYEEGTREEWETLGCARAASSAAVCGEGDELMVFGVTAALACESNSADRMQERAAQAILLRDIFGNPFRPVPRDPSLLTSTVIALARAIYEERAFERMPILADALEEAGCSNTDILSHCRSEGPHVRGCWIVDRVMGK